MMIKNETRVLEGTHVPPSNMSSESVTDNGWRSDPNVSPCHTGDTTISNQMMRNEPIIHVIPQKISLENTSAQ